jgi:phosphate transport system substrate-binding protein
MTFLSNAFRKAVATALIAGATMSAASAQTLTGAGSTFVNPIMTRWIAAYDQQSGQQVNYQPIGSGGGINALISHTADFAGSDVPMNPGELAQAKGGVYHLPDVVGAVVIAYNVPGVGPGIRLDGPVLSDIYLGKITMWNDPRIVKLNPGTNFPADQIFVTHRSDGSGTTAIFTDYLCKVNGDWKSGPGTGKSIDWPIGLGGKGNAGVAGLLKTHKDAIGYVELAYAVQNNIPYAAMENSHGKPIYPSVESAAAAAEGVKVGPDLTASLTDSPNPDGYPITGYSYLIVYRNTSNAAKAADIKKFLSYVVTTGQGEDFTKPLFYARVPASVTDREQAEINSIK